MSSMARSYNTLSGSAVLSGLVDLLTFFFLCSSWASHWLALRNSSPPAIIAVIRVVNRFAVPHEAWRKRSPPLVNVRPWVQPHQFLGLCWAKLGAISIPEPKDRLPRKICPFGQGLWLQGPGVTATGFERSARAHRSPQTS